MTTRFCTFLRSSPPLLLTHAGWNTPASTEKHTLGASPPLSPTACRQGSGGGMVQAGR